MLINSEENNQDEVSNTKTPKPPLVQNAANYFHQNFVPHKRKKMFSNENSD